MFETVVFFLFIMLSTICANANYNKQNITILRIDKLKLAVTMS